MASCPQSSDLHMLQVPTINKSSGFLTPTLRSRSPCNGAVGGRRSKSANRLFVFPPTRINPPSPCSSQDRLIPNRSQTNMEMASYLLSPLSYGGNKTPSSPVPFNDAEETNRRRDVPRILNFGGKRSVNQHQRPLSLVTKPKLKIPTKPDRVMAVPGTFLECGFQSAHWAPSSMVTVALESGIYVCTINEDCNVVEIQNNEGDNENPFCHVLWNSEGNAVIGSTFNGKIKIWDLKHKLRTIKWQLETKHTVRSIALEQEYLLTCGTQGNGVLAYDTRQNGPNAHRSVLTLKSKKDLRTSVNSLAWSPNGHLLACGCESGVTYLWDVRHLAKEMSILRSQEKNPIQVLNWCPWKPSILLSGSSFPNPSICALNIASGLLLSQADCISEITGIQYNPDLKQVATSHHSLFRVSENNPINGSDSSVQLWDFSTNNKLNPLLELGQHEEGIVSMAASPDNKQLLTMGGDELLCLWQWIDNNHHGTTKAKSQTTRSVLEISHLIR